MSNPTPNFLQRLRLEVQNPPAAGDHINLIGNPDGATGTWGWASPFRGVGTAKPFGKFDRTTIATTTYNNAPAMLLTQNGVPSSLSSTGYGVDRNMVSARFPVTAGNKLRVRLTVPTVQSRDSSSSAFVAAVFFAQVLFYDPAGTYLTYGSITPPQSNGSAGSTTPFTAAFTVPSGAYQAEILMSCTNSGGVTTYQQRATFTNVAAFCEPTDPGATVVATPRTWTNILTSTTSIDVDREGLSVGSLHVILRDTSLDPVTSQLLAPGTPARLMCLTQSGTWEPLITTTLGDPTADYDQAAATSGVVDRARKSTTIDLTGTDALTAAANTPIPQAMRLVGVPRILAETGLAWDVDGVIDQSSQADPQGYNENASAADQLVIARDTETALGATSYLWVTRGNVVKARSGSNAGGTVATLTTSDYSKAPTSYALDRVINSVRVKVQGLLATYDFSGWSYSAVETEHGPFRNNASASMYGGREVTLTIAGSGTKLSNTGTPVQRAQFASSAATKVLSANGTPARHVDSVTIPIRSDADLVPTKALLELYDQVTVVTPALTQTARITSISHRITPAGWLMTLAFDVPGSVPAPLSTPSAVTAGDVSTPWIGATLVNGWTAAADPVRYRLNDVGQLVIQGLVKDGSPGTTAFTLADGFRPPDRPLRPGVYVHPSKSGIATIGTDGTVQPGGQSSYTYYSLDLTVDIA